VRIGARQVGTQFFSESGGAASEFATRPPPPTQTKEAKKTQPEEGASNFCEKDRRWESRIPNEIQGKSAERRTGAGDPEPAKVKKEAT